jgi:hypothetical protein
VAITLLAAVMMTVLCTSPVRRTFRFVMEPKMEWFFRRDAGAQARAREKGSAGAAGSGPSAPAAAPAEGAAASGSRKKHS